MDILQFNTNEKVTFNFGVCVFQQVFQTYNNQNDIHFNLSLENDNRGLRYE